MPSYSTRGDIVSEHAAFDRAVARLARGEDEAVPAEYANRIIDGENPLRVFRPIED